MSSFNVNNWLDVPTKSNIIMCILCLLALALKRILLQHWKSIFTYFHCSIQFNSVHKPKIEAQHSGATTDFYLLYSFVIVINILHFVCVSRHFTAYACVCVFVTITFKQSNEKCLIKQKQMISTECIIQTEYAISPYKIKSPIHFY